MVSAGCSSGDLRRRLASNAVPAIDLVMVPYQ
jgi:hypothetical protein